METIGRYRLVRRLGAGSFATVWLGHDDDLDVPVAVKVLADNWAGNEDVRRRFLGEARILRRIRNPRIVAVYDIGTLPDGRPYFVMDFVNGGSLDDLRRGGVAPAVALRLCAQACRAIDVLHDNHVLHRDVTPGNLLIQRTPDQPPVVVLADLGVAKAMAEGSELTMTAGTPAYMAPEQASGGMLDRRVDVYSLTAVTYTMLSGHPPYAVRTVADIIGRDPATDPPPLASMLGAPASLDTVLAAGLAYRPERRPPTAAILADALDVVAGELERSGGGGPAAGVATVLTPAEPRTGRGEAIGGSGSGLGSAGSGGSGLGSSGPGGSGASGNPPGPGSAGAGNSAGPGNSVGFANPVGSPNSLGPRNSGVPGNPLGPVSSAGAGGFAAAEGYPPSGGSGFGPPGSSPPGSGAPAGPSSGVDSSAQQPSAVRADPPPTPGGRAVAGPAAPGGGRKRSNTVFVLLVTLGCIALFGVSLVITVLLLQ